MALAISTQFNKFVEFAETQRNPRTSSAIARFAGEAGNLGARNIQAADPRSDSVGKIGRHGDQRDANNEARTAFRQAVIDMFGGEDYIPKNVRTAMKLQDYDQGRPLTARRIMAVKTAIEAYRQSAEQAFEAASEIALNGLLYAAHGHGGIDHDWNRRVDGLIAVAVNASVGDQDALDVVKASIVDILKVGGANLRTEEQVKARVSNILASVAELRAAAKGNAHVFSAGLELLKLMAGKRMPDGIIRSIVDLTMKQGIGKLKSLTPRTSGINLHKAVAQALGNVDKAMDASGAELAFVADTIMQARLRKFCIAVQLARCSDAEARRVTALFDTEKAAQLASIYGDMINGDFGDIPADMAQQMHRQGLVFTDGIDNIYASLQNRTGVPEENRRVFAPPQNPDHNLVDRDEVANDIHEIAGERAERDLNLFLNNVVAGRGRGAGKVRALYSNVLGERPFQPTETIRNKAGDNILGMFNRNFCKTRKVDGPGLFTADLGNGNLSVVLPGNIALTSGDALDKLASFMTHGEKTTYQSLGDNDRCKVVNLVSMLNRQNAEIGEKAEALTVDSQGRDAKFEFGGNFTKRKFSLSFDDNNSVFVIRCETERALDSLRVKNEAGFEDVPVGAGSKVETSYEIRIPMDEIDRFAGISQRRFAMYDDQYAEDFVNGPGVNPHAHSRIGNVLGGFKIGGERLRCSTSFKLTVN